MKGKKLVIPSPGEELYSEHSPHPVMDEDDSFSCVSSESFEDPTLMALTAQYLSPQRHKVCKDLPGDAQSPSVRKQKAEAIPTVSFP